MTLTILGTGNAVTTECYNTCFVLHESNQYFLVDGGGGSQILHQLKHTGIDWKKIRTIFVTHKHLDHITGIIWMIRMICQSMKQDEYEGEAVIYAHDEVIALLQEFSEKLLPKERHRVYWKASSSDTGDRWRVERDFEQKSYLFRYTVNKGQAVWLLHGIGKWGEINMLRR